MKLQPNARVKALSACEPGEFIRVRWQGEDNWAFVGRMKGAGADDPIVLACLGNPAQGWFGWFKPAGDAANRAVISFGHSQRLIFDPTDDLLDPSRSFDAHTGLFLGSQGAVLVLPQIGQGFTQMGTFGMDTGEVTVGHPPVGFAFIRRWRITCADEEGRQTILYSGGDAGP